MKIYKNALSAIGMSRVAIATAVALYAGMVCAQSNPDAAQTAPIGKSAASSARLLLAQDPTRDCPENATLGCRKDDRGLQPLIGSGQESEDFGGTVGPQSAFGASVAPGGANGAAAGTQGSGSAGDGASGNGGSG